MTSVVCDSGPLTHLWQIGQWQAFGTFDAIHVSTQVAQEVDRHVSLAQMATIIDRDINVDAVSEQEIAAVRRTTLANLTLQEADLATLALARRLAPDLVLTDDLAIRQAAETEGQTPMGSAGVLLRAYKAGLLDKVALNQAIEVLFVHSSLYLSPSFKSYVRRLIATMTGEASTA